MESTNQFFRFQVIQGDLDKSGQMKKTKSVGMAYLKNGQNTYTALGVVATAAAVAAPARAMMVKKLGTEVVSNTAAYTKNAISKVKGDK